jgi:CRP/FNR family transcriptional regulator, cyclic AMP receptor protein
MGGTDPRARCNRPRWHPGSLMSRLDQQTASEFVQLAPAQPHLPGTVLIRQGAEGSHVYLLQAASRSTCACVKVTAASENGIEALLGIRASGDIVGELAVLGHEPRTATVTAVSPLICYAIPAKAFTTFLKRRPDAWEAVTRMIADRLNWANRRRVDYASHEVTVQIARVIADIIETYGYQSKAGSELGVSLSQSELGGLVGSSREAIAKTMRQFRDLGLVETSYRKIIVRDLAGLRSVARLPVQ